MLMRTLRPSVNLLRRRARCNVRWGRGRGPDLKPRLLHSCHHQAPPIQGYTHHIHGCQHHRHFLVQTAHLRHGLPPVEWCSGCTEPPLLCPG